MSTLVSNNPPVPACWPCFEVMFSNPDGSPGARLVGQWSGTKGCAHLPAIGSRVLINFNGFGPGVVLGYFVEAGYLGLVVKCDNRPAWHVKQNGDKHPFPHVFGAEVSPVESAAYSKHYAACQAGGMSAGESHEYASELAERKGGAR